MGQKSRGLTWADHLAAQWKLARTGVRVEAAAESGGHAEAVAASLAHGDQLISPDPESPIVQGLPGPTCQGLLCQSPPSPFLSPHSTLLIVLFVCTLSPPLDQALLWEGTPLASWFVILPAG